MTRRDALAALGAAPGAVAGAGPLNYSRALAAPATAGLHYQPGNAIFGDTIPFYWQGVHHVFYLKQDFLPGGKLTRSSWYHLVSKDLVHWEDLGPALLPDQQDQNCSTGSVVESEGVFHAFYSARREGLGSTVCVATSRDLLKWTKSPDNPVLTLDKSKYKAPNWRDPHVFWNPEARQWWMAVAAHRDPGTGYPYAGVVALATSPDLRHWTVQSEPMAATREGPAGECPDVFPFGDGWAMVYYADTTRIRLADTPRGPWRRPRNDAPWGLHFQAGKTEFDGRRRIIHAYLERAESDYAEHVYGGAMSLPRELYPDAQGGVATRLVPEIIAACKDDATEGKGAAVFTPAPADSVAVTRGEITLKAGTGSAALAVWNTAPADLFLTADVTLAQGAAITLLLRGSPSKTHPGRDRPNPLDDSYALTLDSVVPQVTLRRHEGWGRRPALRAQPLDLPTNRPVKLHLMLHGNILEAFIDDRISFSCRVQLPGGALALLVRDETVSLKGLRIAKVP